MEDQCDQAVSVNDRLDLVENFFFPFILYAFQNLQRIPMLALVMVLPIKQRLKKRFNDGK